MRIRRPVCHISESFRLTICAELLILQYGST
jgi:hypothetical protein